MGGPSGTTSTAGSAGLGSGGSADAPDGGVYDPGSLNLPTAPCEPPIGDWCQRLVTVDEYGPYEIGLDGDGRVLVAGGAVRDSNGQLDVAVLKLEPTGEVIWGRQVGSDDRDRLDGMAVDPSGNVFVAGSNLQNDDQRSFIAKVSAAGELSWFEQPDVLRSAADVAADPDGNAVLLVESGDIFKYASNGDILWQKRAGYFVGGWAVAVDARGDIFAILNTLDGSDAVRSGLVKLSSNGEVLWEHAISDEEATPYALALDSGGDLLLLGITGMQKYLSRHSATGELLFSQPLEAQKLTTADDLALDGRGNVFVVGMATDFGKPYYDAYLAKYDRDGQVLWGEALGQRGSSSTRGVAVSPEGVAYVTGDLESGAFVTRVSPP